MSRGIVYHCFGITGRGNPLCSYSFRGGTEDLPDPSRSYGSCVFRMWESRKVMKKGTVFRRFMTLPVGLRPTIIEFAIRRVFCATCGLTRQVKIGFAEPDRTQTNKTHLDGLPPMPRVYRHAPSINALFLAPHHNLLPIRIS